MQESLLAAAEAARATVRRGVTVQRIEPGRQPAVVVNGSSEERITTRLVVAADGRGSASRKWAGFMVKEQSNDYYMAGVLLSDVRSSPDLSYYVFSPDLGMCIGLLNIGRNRSRGYFNLPPELKLPLAGPAVVEFILERISKSISADERDSRLPFARR
jgi:2-polyprenyl-6-methoxyphenol hydroxylase-like FAD-dependent oxidoreductase